MIRVICWDVVVSLVACAVVSVSGGWPLLIIMCDQCISISWLWKILTLFVLCRYSFTSKFWPFAPSLWAYSSCSFWFGNPLCCFMRLEGDFHLGFQGCSTNDTPSLPPVILFKVFGSSMRVELESSLAVDGRTDRCGSRDRKRERPWLEKIVNATQ